MRGLAIRIALVLVGALVLVVALVIAIGALNLRSAALGVPLPTPDRVQAIAELIERSPRDEIPAILPAFRSPDLDAAVLDQRPPVKGTVILPGLTLAMNAYSSRLGGRPIVARLDLGAEDRGAGIVWSRGRWWSPHPVRLIVGLKDGRSLMLEAHTSFAEQFTGLRLSLLVLLAAVCAGAVSLVVLRNQIRPLERLVAAVERFGTNMEASALPEQGAQEVRRLTTSFNRLQAQVTSLIAGRTRMVAAIGHDLGTYLTRLRLRTEYIADADQRARAIRDIEDMHALMTDTLAMAKLDHDSETMEPTDLRDVARASVSRFQGRGPDIAICCPDAALTARVRPSIIGRVFDNLIANALKYGGSAELTLFRQDRWAEILIDDHGPGIAADEREAVLEPFYRRDNARNLDERGFGLGLAIVSEIVKRHSGTLDLEDRPGGGLRVRVRLPLAA